MTLLAVGVAAGMVGTGLATHGNPLARRARSPSGLFDVAFEQTMERYVTRPDDGRLVQVALDGMLRSLDPHSSYMSPEEWRTTLGTDSGRYGGTGMEVTGDPRGLRVVAPFAGGPAERAGVLSGDVVEEIDDEPTSRMSVPQATGRLRGSPGTSVTLRVATGDGTARKVAVTREPVVEHAVRSRTVGQVAYLRLTRFNELATSDVREALGRLAASAPTGYVLDLRGNPGGPMDQAVGVAGLFLDGGVVATTEGRTTEDDRTLVARGGDVLSGAPLVVMVDGGSASSSEIVAGALQDRGRARVVGTRSFGKGTVQSLFELGKDGEHGVLRLTTAFYRTPSGRKVQGEGVVPDRIVVRDTAAISETEDVQLAAALDELASATRVVPFGGGG